MDTKYIKMMSGATLYVNKGSDGRVRRGSKGKRGEADWPFHVVSYNVIFIQDRGLPLFILRYIFKGRVTIGIHMSKKHRKTLLTV